MTKVHEILSEFNQILRFTKHYVISIKYHEQYSPRTKLTSLFLRRKTALVLANPGVRWKNKKQNAKSKIKAEKKELNIQRRKEELNMPKEGQNKSLVCPGSNSRKA